MRLTNDTRDNILRRAIANLPAIDYSAEIRDIVQGAVTCAMPPEVRAAWDNADTMRYLWTADVDIKDGNKHIMTVGGIRGISSEQLHYSNTLRVFMDEAAQGISRPIAAKIASALRASGKVAAYQNDRAKLQGVKDRLKAALYSVGTVRRLYDVLEPELHHLIPVIADHKVPVVSVRVADDLRALGAQLPEPPQKDASE